jgi:hypothetical protein
VGQQMIRNGQLVRHARGDLLSVESKKKEISREKKEAREKTRENSKKETQG